MKTIAGVLLLFLSLLIHSSFITPALPHCNKWRNAKAVAPSMAVENDSLPQNYFGPVLDISPASIVGNFGEPRRLHFHTGLDFRTNQEVGHPVFAAAGGYVSRINVSASGYGNALYITHPNGYVSVYGHLLKFNQSIEARLRKEQYAKENFAVDFNLPPNELPVTKGETIAFSGNTGGSGGPHLHFEIRDSLERVYNPMLFGYLLKDDLKPLIRFLKFYPLDSLKYKCDGHRTKVIGKQGIYEVTGGTVKLNAKLVGVSVNTYDIINLSDAHIGVYNITAFDGNRMIFQFQPDRLSFPDKRYVLSQIDYPIFTNEFRTCFHKTFIEPGNHCPVYPVLFKQGEIDLSDGRLHHIQIEVTDYAGNVALVKFNLQYDSQSDLFKPHDFKYTTRFDYDHYNHFADSEIKLDMPSGCLFDDVFLTYSSALSTDPAVFSRIHEVGSPQTQVFDWFNLAIKCKNLPSDLSDKAVVVYKDAAGITVSRGGSFKDEFVYCKAREFGTYCIRIDSTAPQIKALNVEPGRNMRNSKKLLFKITDNLSGISYFDTYIDNEWTVTDYDAKSATLTHTLNPGLAKGEHIFKVVVTDERSNRAEYAVKFLY